jgi:hypothetical protein
MDATHFLDHDVSKIVRVSRSHISRIRRGKSGANKAVALRLQELTGISWQHFIEPTLANTPPKPRRKRRVRPAKRRVEQGASP